MKRMSRSKKGLFFNIAIALMTIGVLTYALILLSNADTIKDVNDRIRFIGPAQLQLYGQYQRGEAAFNYLDIAVKLASADAMASLDEGSLILEESKCGDHRGYGLWTTETEECFPAVTGKAFTHVLDDNLDPILGQYDDAVFPDTNYEYTVKPLDAESSLVVGTPKERVAFPLSFTQVGLSYENLGGSGSSGSAGSDGSGIGSGSAQPMSDQECNYCSAARKYVKELFGDPEYDKCIKSGTKCCRAQCPPGTKFITVIPPYRNQCAPDKSCGWSKSSCSNACNSCAAWMAFQSRGKDIPFEGLYCNPNNGGNKEYQVYTGGGGGYHAGIIRGAKKEGFSNTAAIPGSFDKIKAELEKGNPVPFVITQPKNWATSERGSPGTGGHYILAIGFTDNALIINDPYVSRPQRRTNPSDGEHQVWSRNFVDDVCNIARMVPFRP